MMFLDEKRNVMFCSMDFDTTKTRNIRNEMSRFCFQIIYLTIKNNCILLFDICKIPKHKNVTQKCSHNETSRKILHLRGIKFQSAKL